METHVLVEISSGTDEMKNMQISKILRTFESERSASDAAELLREAAPERLFMVFTVQHIDR